MQNNTNMGFDLRLVNIADNIKMDFDLTRLPKVVVDPAAFFFIKLNQTFFIFFHQLFW